ncbi:MAG TPA: CHASE domain-containing protein [Actinomycetes bacterium]|nr:CHASE domain-containing protein [Actinomycetes bacterium]
MTRQREERLDRGATSRTTAIGNALRQYENVLQAQRSVWLSSRSVTHEDFGNFVRTLDLPQRYPGLVGLGWRSFVPHGQAAGFVAAARRDRRPDFAIHPPGRRPAYYVTLYNEPAGRFHPTWGQDARAMPTVLDALKESGTAAAPPISGQTTLADDLALPVADRHAHLRRAQLPAALRTAARQPGADRAHHPGSAGAGHRDRVSVLLGALLWLLAQVSSLYRRVGRMARIDALTGVHNRRVWDRSFRVSWRAAHAAASRCALP